MKTINKIKIMLLACVASVSTSCMDLQPMANLGDEYVWTNAENFQLFANQFYAWDRGFSTMISDGIYCDDRADMATRYIATNTYSEGNHVVPNTDSSYGTFYKRIYYTNLLLTNAANYSDKSAISSPMGEAYFHRALWHFQLMRLYGDAIVLTRPLDITDSRLYASQDNRSVVADQIISDLYNAIECLPATSTETARLTKPVAQALLAHIALYEGTWQKFHNHCSGGAQDAHGNFDYTAFGKYAVGDVVANSDRSTALLTIARDAAKAVMDSGQYELFYNEILGTDSYRYMFSLDDAAQCNPAGVGKAANKEYIYFDRFRTGDKTTSITSAMVNNAWATTRKMADTYLCIDGLPISISSQFEGRDDIQDEFKNRDPRMTSSILAHNHGFWNQVNSRVNWDDSDYALQIFSDTNAKRYTGYINSKWGTHRTVADGYETPDYPIIRYAEVLLIYAEAQYELSNTITDADLNLSLNLVRKRAGMPSLTNSFVTENGLSMREEIRRERTVEFYLECLRLDDIKRWAMGSTEMPGDLEGVNWNAAYQTAIPLWSPNLNANGDIVYRTGRQWVDSRHYLYPLPISEMNLNPNLRQNAGW